MNNSVSRLSSTYINGELPGESDIISLFSQCQALFCLFPSASNTIALRDSSNRCNSFLHLEGKAPKKKKKAVK